MRGDCALINLYSLLLLLLLPSGFRFWPLAARVRREEAGA